MDWLKALEEEKKKKRIESRPDQTYQTSNPATYIWGTAPYKKQNKPFKPPQDGYPIPTDEAEFAADERAAIQEFDGGSSNTASLVLDIFQGTVH